LRKPSGDITFRLWQSGGPYIPACTRYIQKFARRRCPDRFGAGLQQPDKVNHSLVDLLGSLLLGPMTATWQQESSPKLWYKLRQVGDDLVHLRKGQNEIAVPGSLVFTAGLLPSEENADKRGRALLILSALLGAINLSWAVSDPILSREILDQVRQQLVDLIAGNVLSKRGAGLKQQEPNQSTS